MVGPRHARPQMGAARGSGPAEDGGFDTARHGRQEDLRGGRRNRRLERTKEQTGAHIPPCPHEHRSFTVGHPMVGETEHASHTEFRTLPDAAPTTSKTKRLASMTTALTGIRCFPILHRQCFSVFVDKNHLVGPSHAENSRCGGKWTVLI